MHFPFMLLLVACCYQTWGIGIRMQPERSATAFLCFVVATTWLSCYLGSLLTESHTGAVRNALATALAGRPGPAAG